MARRLEAGEVGELVFQSSSDDSCSDIDASSDSSFSPEREDCSESSSSESGDTFSECEDGAAPNSIFWHQPTASFMPKFPSHDYIPCKPRAELPSILHEIDSFKVLFPKSLCIFIAQCTNERIYLHKKKESSNFW